MKKSLNKFLLIILFILNVSCESKTGGSTITISSECNDQSLGCDGICSSSALENDVCGGVGEKLPFYQSVPYSNVHLMFVYQFKMLIWVLIC